MTKEIETLSDKVFSGLSNSAVAIEDINEFIKIIKKELNFKFWSHIDYDNCLLIESKIHGIIDKHAGDKFK